MKTVLRILVVAALLPTLLYGARPVEGAQVVSQSASNLFQEAMHLEEVVGDLQAAIRLYQRVVEQFSTQRSLAAAALVRMGQCYEKLGDAQARAAYERVVSNYADQLPAAAEARSRLASLQSDDEVDRPKGIVTRQVWASAPVPGGSEEELLGGVSPDGRYVAFVSWGLNRDLAVYDTETGLMRLLTDWKTWAGSNEYVTGMAWSRDGARIAYTRWDSADYLHQELRVLPVDGSDGCWLTEDEFYDHPIPMACSPSSATDDHLLVANDERPNVKAMAWSRGGDFIVALFRGWDGVSRIGTVSTEDGTVRILKTLGQHDPLPLSLSPDDSYIVYEYPQEAADEGRRPVFLLGQDDQAAHDVFILATDGSSEERLVSHAADDERPFWTPDGGRVVFLSDRSGRRGLYAVEVLDGRPVGDPELVRPDVGPMATMGFSRSGTLYYTLDTTVTDVHVAELDLNPTVGPATLSEPSPLTERWEGNNSFPSWSPDGRRIAFFSRRGESLGDYAVVKSMDTGEEHDFALPFALRHRRTSGSPEWSADGSHLLIEGSGTGVTGDLRPLSYRLDLETGDVAREAFMRDFAGRNGGAIRRVATAVQEKALRAADIRIVFNDPSQDVSFTEFGEALRPGEVPMWMRGGVFKMLPGGEVEEIGPPGNPGRWALSPDGTQLAFDTNPSSGLFIMPATGGEVRELPRPSRPSEVGEGQPLPVISARTLQWAPDGQGLLYGMGWRGAGPEPELWHIPIQGGSPERLDLPELVRQIPFRGFHYRFHPDGRRVAFWTRTRGNEMWLMEGFPWQHAGR